MALRNQPYLPLYVQDFSSDEKLRECSASATGVYIRLICLLHKCEEYGKISLKEKDITGEDTLTNFANKLSKQMPYPVETIRSGLQELYEEGVIQIEGNTLSQKRMVHDAELSEKRALAGQKGYEAKVTKVEKKQAPKAPKKAPEVKEELSPLEKAYKDYADMRKSIKKPMTERAMALLRKKNEEISRDEAEQIHNLETAILHGWQSVYTDKEYKPVRKFEEESELTDSISMDELRAMMEEV